MFKAGPSYEGASYEDVPSDPQEGLLPDESEKSHPVVQFPSQFSKHSRIWPRISLLLNILLTFALMVLSLNSFTHRQRSPLPPYPSTLYSPVQHLVRYQTTTFVNGLRDYDNDDLRRSVYLGPPTEESDAAWDKLYDIGGINQISASEATKLGQETAKVCSRFMSAPKSIFPGYPLAAWAAYRTIGP